MARYAKGENLEQDVGRRNTRRNEEKMLAHLRKIAPLCLVPWDPFVSNQDKEEGVLLQCGTRKVPCIVQVTNTTNIITIVNRKYCY